MRSQDRIWDAGRFILGADPVPSWLLPHLLGALSGCRSMRDVANVVEWLSRVIPVPAVES